MGIAILIFVAFIAVMGVSVVLIGPLRDRQRKLTPEERDSLSLAFGSDVKEVCGGNFGPLRRELGLVPAAGSGGALPSRP